MRSLLGNLGYRFFPFITLNIYCHTLPSGLKNSAENSVESLLGIPLYATYFFSLALFNSFLQIKRNIHEPKGLFPEKASFEWESPDGSERIFWAPLFKFAAGISDKVHKFQSGYLHIYILMMTIALIAMVIWAIVS